METIDSSSFSQTAWPDFQKREDLFFLPALLQPNFTLTSYNARDLIPTSHCKSKLGLLTKITNLQIEEGCKVKLKLISVTLVIVLLLIALMQISGVVHDRQNFRNLAIESVTRSLAGPQRLTGPLIHRSCTEEWDTLIEKRVQTDRRDLLLISAPTMLSVNGTSQLEPRARGLHATQVFNLKAQLVAQWSDLEALNPKPQHANSRLSCGQPLLMLSVSEARGIRHAGLRAGGETLALKSGTFYGNLPRGVHTALSQSLVFTAPFEAQFELELLGTEQIAIVPMGSDTRVHLTSNWAHPSFGGQFLPVEKKVTDQGFEATWKVSSLASTAQLDIAKSKPDCSRATNPQLDPANTCLEALSVTFIDPTNAYALSDRATKYGLLFIGLTFLAVGLFEFMKALQVHPIQYFLVGAAMCMFFLLLVSLSEHLSFATAYLLASTACVFLLMFYASYMLKGWLRGLPFGLGIGALYGMLYILLQMEQTALVLGSIALFLVLAAIMALTRQVNWYERFAMNAKQPTTTP